jgi:hypothetical protein
MTIHNTHPLVEFLRKDLDLDEDAIAFATRQASTANQLPLVLWQYGFVNLQELEQIWDWSYS